MAEESETVLADRVRKGDMAAFEMLCKRIEAPLFHYALGLIRNPQEAEDVAQETLLRLYRMARSGRLDAGRNSCRSLAFTVVHNLSMDAHRRARHRIPPCAPSPSGPSPSESTERALLREQIDLALARIPDTHRSALLLREFGGLTYSEIAEALTVSSNVVKIWIYRARRKLAGLLDREGQYVPDADDSLQGG